MDSKGYKVALVAVAIIAIVGWFVPAGSDAPLLGGTTNFDAIDVSDGYSVDATTVIDGSGNVDAPITSSSLKVGDASATTYSYYGAGDGCAAVYFTSSTTQTVQATSTSFCN